MNTKRKTAIIVGVLYIIGTVSGFLTLVVTKPILDAPDYLIKVSATGNHVITGALLMLVMGLALAMISVAMFSILKRQNEALALGYVVFRGGLETVTYIGVAISWLLLLPLNEAYVQAGTPNASSFQPLGMLLLKAAETSANTTEIIFPLGAMMFSYLLYQSRLIPRWISGWGFVGAIPYLAAGLLHLFGVTGQMSTITMVLVLPTAVQEMVMLVWLIIKGFNPSATASLSAKTKLNEIK
jgi:hypothetical protein